MKKKKVVKKKKKNEEEIKPTKHENIGNINCYSEEVAIETFNKIFTNVFINLHVKNMDKIIDAYYVSYILNSVNRLIELLNLNHDRDISIQNQIQTNSQNKTLIVESNKEKLKKRQQDKKVYNKNNNNINLNSQDDLIIKRTYMDKFDNLKLNDNSLLYSAKISNTNFWGTIPEPQSFAFDRTSTYKNAIIISDKPEKNLKDINALSANEKKQKKFTRLKSKFINAMNKRDKKDDIYKIKKKRYFKVSDDLPSETISNEILGIIPEDDDIKKMRNELLEKINKKIMEEKQEKEKKLLEEMAKRKKFQKKSKNKDNENDLDPKLLINEFVTISSNQREIKSGSTKEILEEEKKQLIKKAKKNIEYNQTSKIKPEKDRINDMKKKQKFFVRKYVLNNAKNDDYNDEDDEPRGNSKPSGSNFDLIKPEIGVIIQENIKVKSGGINFYEKYNKLSVNDFDRTMNSVFDRNFSNFNYLGYNTITSGKNLLSSNNYNLNNTTTALNNKTDLLTRQKNNEDDNTKIQTNNINNYEEYSEKNLFRNTFKNKIENLKKKFIYKSKSKISMSNKITSDKLREVLNTTDNDKSYYYYSHNLFHSNKSKNEFNNNFELSYIGKSKVINKNFFSPLPTNLVNTYKHSLLKNYFYNAGDGYQTQRINSFRYNKFNIIDTFNKNLVEGKKDYNERLYKIIMRTTKDEFLPNIRHGETFSANHEMRTKNFFHRKRKNK